MTDKPYASNSMGLELQASHLKIALLSLQKGHPKLEKLFEAEIDYKDKKENLSSFFNHVNPLYINEKTTKSATEKPNEPTSYKTFSENLKEFQNQNLTIASLSSSEVLTRSLEIKLKKDKDIEAALPFQAEALLPYPYELGLIDKINVEKKEEGTLLTLFAAKKDKIKKNIDLWQKIGIDPEVIASESVALAAISNYFFNINRPHFILFFKENSATALLVKNKKILASQTSTFNQEAEFFSEKEFQEVIRLLYALAKPLKGEVVEDLLLIAPELINRDLLNTILIKNGKKISLLQPNNSFNIEVPLLEKFAIPIGLALTTLLDEENKINFRQEELSYKEPWKHLKRPLANFLLVTIFLSFSFYLFGKTYIGSTENSIKQEYLNLLSSMNKDFKDFEYQYFLKKDKEEAETLAENSTLEKLSQNDIDLRLEALLQELRSFPDLFPLFPNIPRVSDVLGWISQHPNVVEKNGEETKALLELESFSYVMLKKPDDTKKKEKYQVKVELEFSTSTPKFAREFHDALIAKNQIVDPKGEVKWSSNRGKYKASFFLKDRTIYPQTISSLE